MVQTTTIIDNYPTAVMIFDSDQTLSDIHTIPSDHININKYLRCSFKYFKFWKVGKSIIVLIPSCCNKNNTSKWGNLLQSGINLSNIHFNKVEYTGYHYEVTINPIYNNAIIGMQLLDYKSGFGNNNYECHFFVCVIILMCIGYMERSTQ